MITDKENCSEMKLLMHMCCGPCSCYPLKKLRSDGIEPTGYFFNPNIHPYKEWEERLENARKFADLMQMDFIADENRRDTRQNTDLTVLPRRCFTAFISSMI